MRRSFSILVLALVVGLLLGGVVFAQGADKQVGLVVRFPDGHTHTEVVTVPASATVADVLKSSKVGATLVPKSWGQALCAIGNTGCSADDCFCDASHFWAFYIQQGSAWASSQVGVDAYTPKDKEVVGFAWSGFDANYNPTVQPPFLTFAQIAAPTPAEIPEPATLFLLGSGLVSLVEYRRRRKIA